MKIIKSLCDLDFYKISMLQFAYHQFPKSYVEYEFKNRNESINLLPFIDEIRKQIDMLSDLNFSKEELNYLESFKNGEIFKKDFIEFLSKFKLKKEQVLVFNDNDKLAIKISGLWTETILFETLILSIINEVYFLKTQPNPDKAIGISKLDSKIEKLKALNIPFKFMEFGTRRRYSQNWQENVVLKLKKEASDFLIGTSNIDLARRLNLPLLGTQAHEMFSFHQSLSYEECHKITLKNWVREYSPNLLIALSDIYSTEAFLKDMSIEHAKLFQGLRQDSGDPYVWVNKVIKFYKEKGIDPMDKIALFSDGLTIDKAIDINNYCHNKIKTIFGIGTSLTNDLGFPALNIVIKMIKANGKPVVKISDEPSKAIGNPETIKHIKEYFKIS